MITWVKSKQWPLAGKFGEFEYSPKIRRFWRVLKFVKTSDPPNFCDLRRRIWRVLSEFSEFSEFGEFGEGRLDRFIPKNIFFLYIKRPSLKISQIRQMP
jgi:hypothetical protein